MDVRHSVACNEVAQELQEELSTLDEDLFSLMLGIRAREKVTSHGKQLAVALLLGAPVGFDLEHERRT